MARESFRSCSLPDGSKRLKPFMNMYSRARQMQAPPIEMHAEDPRKQGVRAIDCHSGRTRQAHLLLLRMATT